MSALSFGLSFLIFFLFRKVSELHRNNSVLSIEVFIIIDYRCFYMQHLKYFYGFTVEKEGLILEFPSGVVDYDSESRTARVYDLQGNAYDHPFVFKNGTLHKSRLLTYKEVLECKLNTFPITPFEQYNQCFGYFFDVCL